MNPGTTLFIVIGIIGLLVYISKALKPSLYEKFTILGQDDVSNKGKEALSNLQNGTTDFEVLMNAFSTPDLNMISTNKLPMGSENPKLSDFKKKVEMTQLPPVSTENMPVSNTIPLREPASLLTMNSPENKKTPITLSDSQGLTVQNNQSGFNNQTQPDLEPNNTPSFSTSSIPIARTFNQSTNTKSRENAAALKKKQSPGYTPKREKIVYVKEKCPPMPDMSLYIRKDSIPCWGCNLK
jgi:hypothetical protein